MTNQKGSISIHTEKYFSNNKEMVIFRQRYIYKRTYK